MLDAGNISLRFSVENAEVVRKALADLGKDGEKALKQFDNSAKPATKSMLALSDVVDLVRGRAQGLATQGGAVASLLTKWGPAGLAAGAGVGAAYLALDKLNQIVEQFAAKAQRVRDGAAALGTTTLVVQALHDEGGKLGLTNEKVTEGFNRLSRAVDDARRGEGKLLEEVRRVDPALADRLARTRDLAGAIDVVVQAYQRAGDAAQRANIAGVLGKDSAFSVLLQRIGAAGGSGPLAEAFRPDAIPQETIERVTRIKIEIAQIKERSANIWGGIFSAEVLENQRRTAEFWLSIAEAAERFAKARDENIKNEADARARGDRPSLGEFMLPPGFDDRPPAPAPIVPTLPPNFGNRLDREGASPLVPAPASALSSEYVLKQLREQVALLGAAATPADQLRLKIAELAVETSNWSNHQGAANRGLEAFKLAQAQAAVAIRQRIGVAGEEEMLTVRLAELQDMRAKGWIRSNEEMIAAERRVRKEVQDTIAAMAVQNSATPALTQLAQEAADVNKQMDAGGAGWVRSLASEFSILNRSTDSLADRMKNLGLRLLDVFLQAQLMKYALGPLSTGFGSFLTNIFPGAAATSGPGNVPASRNAMSSASMQGASGGMRGGQLGGGTTFVFAPSIDARGADAGAVAGIDRTMQRERGEFERSKYLLDRYVESPAFKEKVHEAASEAQSRRW